MEDSDEKPTYSQPCQEEETDENNKANLKEMVLKQDETNKILTKSKSNEDISSQQIGKDEAVKVDIRYDEEEKENDLKERNNKTSNEDIIDGFSFLSFDSETALKVSHVYINKSSFFNLI